MRHPRRLARPRRALVSPQRMPTPRRDAHLRPTSKARSPLALRLWRALRGMPLVISYPKAGRTWLRVMLDELGARAEYTHFGAGVKGGRPLEEIRANPLWCAGRPSLLLVRDPRDTLVSSYFHVTHRRGTWSGALPEFVRDPRFGIEKLARWNLMWAELGCRRTRFAIVEYEALHRTPRETLRASAGLFGVHPDDTALERALAAGRIDVMRERERSGAYLEQYAGSSRPATRPTRSRSRCAAASSAGTATISPRPIGPGATRYSRVSTTGLASRPRSNAARLAQHPRWRLVSQAAAGARAAPARPRHRPAPPTAGRPSRSCRARRAAGRAQTGRARLPSA